jgi:two-component system, OmpR family, sensor histidine kinase MtrB
VAFAVLALLLSTTLAMFSYQLTRTYLIDRRESTARREAYLNARVVRDALRANSLDVVGALAQTQIGSDGVIIVRVDSQWFGTSVGVGRDDIPTSLRRLVIGGSAGTQNTHLSSVPNMGVGVPLPAVNAEFFEFIPVRELEQTLSLLARALVAAALVVTLIGAIVGRYASGRVLRPVRRMAVTATGIADGAIDERLDAEGDSDLEPLVDAFNSMVSALRDRIEREARFSSNVSHELRSPLATITAALNVARRRRSDEDSDAALDVLESEVHRFSDLVVDLLEISRMEAGVSEAQFERIDPARLVSEVLSSTNRDHVPVRIEPAAPSVIMGDKRRIAQVLTNLLNNADAYGGGAIAVVVAGTGDALLISVDDDGPGVPVDQRRHVFERFARGVTSASTPGTGLGLALAVEHLRLHNGQIWIDDSPTGGARFVIEIPSEVE